jgi:hypothetical protein
MSNPLFDSAGLAIVAYAEVAANGTSTVTNSGVTTTKVGTGVYTVTLPPGKTQLASRDLIFVQPITSVAFVPTSSSVDDRDPAVKGVQIYVGSPLTTTADCAFSILILRTIVPPPAGAPA